MFTFFAGASYKIARNLIKATGLKESLDLFQENNFSNIGAGEILKLLLAMDACNLLQTMKEDFIVQEIPEEDLLDTADDYVVENLKSQSVIPCRDGAERMDQCQEILAMAAKFQEYWSKDEWKDPGPRFYCVKDLLGRLGCEANTPIHDNLFEFVYEQHNRFIRYFRTLLEPFQPEGFTEPLSEPPSLAVAIHNPSPEPSFAALDALIEKGTAPEVRLEAPSEALPEIQPEAQLAAEIPAEEPGLAAAVIPPTEDFSPAENLSPLPAEPKGLDDLLSAPMEPFRGGIPAQFSKPTPQMLDELFQKVNPVDPGFQDPSHASGIIPEGENLAGEKETPQ